MRRSATGWALVGVQVLLFVILLLLPWRDPSTAGILIGLLLAIAGAFLCLKAIRGLGSALTATPVPITGAGLRTTGAYRSMRHPIYTGVLLITLGLLVALGSPMSWAWGAVILVFFWLKATWEDSLLRAEYGTQWQDWATRTGRLLPRIRP